MPLIVTGNVAPMDPADPTATFPGSVYLTDNGRVDSVRRTDDDDPPGFSQALEINVGQSFVYPGLLDLHSHIAYNALPLWTEPSQDRAFLHHNSWTRADTYSPSITWPAYLLAKGAPEALLVYVQVRALAGGTTAIQGWPSANRNPTNKLLRSVEDEDFGTGNRNLIRASTLTLKGDALRDRAEYLEDGGGFIYHCGEGRRGSLATREFNDAATANCLRQNLIAIHLNSVEGDAFRRWNERAQLAGDLGPGTVVWSPFSNLWLYGETTDVAAAVDHNVSVCLGTDWGPSGTKNLLGEMKVARLWSEHAGLGLTAFDLVAMVTCTPGDALSRCWDRQAGRLTVGALGDLAVVAPRHADPWENLVLAREEDVQLVVVDGQARLGTRDLMRAAGTKRTTSVRIGGRHRRHVSIVDPTARDPRWCWSDVLDEFENVRLDPEGAMAIGMQATTAVAGLPPSDIGANDPLVLELDMPGAEGLFAGPPPDPASVIVPKPPSLRHDRNWRADVKGRGFHGGILDRLDRFYQ